MIRDLRHTRVQDSEDLSDQLPTCECEWTGLVDTLARTSCREGLTN